MMGRLLLGVFLLLTVALQYRLWLTPQGMPRSRASRARSPPQRAENATLTERNAQLEAEVEDLRQGLEAVEERARTELGMVGHDESFFEVVESEPAHDEQGE